MKDAQVSASLAFVPETHQLDMLKAALQRCQACPLYLPATQAVFGEGRETAMIMLVGEQPGDREDIEGRPFVGPAGQVLDGALERAGIARDKVYVTNAVKHFKFEPRGKRRLHARPNYEEIGACRAWLEAEIDAIKPRRIVCLGATAAQSFFGRKFSVTRERGRILETRWAEAMVVTWHPSMVLRAREPAARARVLSELEADLKLVA